MSEWVLLELWGYHIDSALEWIALWLLVLVGFGAGCVMVWFIQKYTTGIMGGFILLLAGVALLLFPAYHLIWSELSKAQILVGGMAILLGCIAMLVGTFKLTSFNDF